MNSSYSDFDPTDPTTTDPTTNTPGEEYRRETEECIRRNAGSAILIAIGAGIALGLLARALRPAPTPQERMSRLVDDLEDRLRNLTGPILRRAGALASDGLEAAQHGEARAERFLGDATRRLRKLFS
jgi:hypothetical protein